MNRTGPETKQSAALERPIIQRWAGVAVLLLLIAGTFAIAYLRASSAAHTAQQAATNARTAATQAQTTADCVNRVLAERDKLTGELHAADVTRVSKQKAAEEVKKRGLGALAAAKTKPQGRAAFAEYSRGELLFQKTLTDYIATSNRIRAEQLQHPLGKC